MFLQISISTKGKTVLSHLSKHMSKDANADDNIKCFSEGDSHSDERRCSLGTINSFGFQMCHFTEKRRTALSISSKLTKAL